MTTLVNQDASLVDVHEQMLDIDHESALLIAELQLQDALALSANAKGKARADAPLSDQELALRLQTEELSGWKQTHQDATLAESINHALDTDAGILEGYRMIEETAAADRLAAQRLQADGILPQMNDSQRRVGEDRSFYDVFKQTTVAKTSTSKAKSATASSDQWQFGTSFGFSSKDTNAGPSQERSKRAACVSCLDQFHAGDLLKAECGDHWCSACLASIMEVYLRDERLHPLRCCKKAFAQQDLFAIVKNRKVLTEFETKRQEYEVPAQDRVYCARPTCSEFLGSADRYKPSSSSGLLRAPPGTAVCGKCTTQTCVGCRKGSHPGDSCTQNEAVDQVRALAKEAGWQTCPGCSTIVELHHGCYHMTCRCRTEFCYVCGVPWKNCSCPQWEERRLLATAEMRAEHLMGGQQARQAQPEVFLQQVQRAVENIRWNHGCYQHRWVGRPGGNCEECGDYLPVFLKMCRDCNLLVCRRCALNRL